MKLKSIFQKVIDKQEADEQLILNHQGKSCSYEASIPERLHV